MANGPKVPINLGLSPIFTKEIEKKMQRKFGEGVMQLKPQVLPWWLQIAGKV